MSLSATSLVTPEAVALDLPAAGIGSRSLAKLLDTLIQVLVAVGVGFAGASAVDTAVPDWVGITVVLVGLAALLWGYPTAFETLMRGRTPGKAALGLRVVTRAGGQVRFRHAALRAALGLVELVVTAGGVAVVSALLTDPPRRLGDLAAGTFVVTERTPGGAGAMRFQAPAAWSDYAARLDAARIDATTYAAVRTALRRAAQAPRRDHEPVLRRVAHRVASRVSPAPPQDIDAQAFLTCVAAAYQRRFADLSPPSRPSPASASASAASAPETDPASPDDAASRSASERGTSPRDGGFTPPA